MTLYSPRTWVGNELITATKLNTMEGALKGRCALAVVEPSGAFGDYATIQAAINAVQSAGGGDVVLRSGTYVITSPLTIQGDNIRLLGEGYPLLSLANGVDDNVLEVGISDATFNRNVIAGIAIDGNKGNQTAGHGIYVVRENELKIYDCRIYDAKDDGIRFDHSTVVNYPWVCNNYINACNGNGIFNNSTSFADAIFARNVINSPGIDGIDWAGYRARIVNNYIYNTGAYGVQIRASEQLISGNHLMSIGSTGVYSTGALDRNQVIGNHIYNTTGDGIELSSQYHVINGNNLCTIGGKGIVIGNRVVSIGNTLIDVEDVGIYVAGTFGSTVIGNRLEDCCGTTGVAYIVLDAATHVAIIGNMLKWIAGSTNSGIEEINAADANEIVGNTLQSFTTDITTIGGNSEAVHNMVVG